jgi:hypothetical protein
MVLGPVIAQAPPPGFDPNLLFGQLIPLFGAVVALLVGGVVLQAFFKSDLATAIAERIRAGMHRRKHWKGLGGEWIDAPGGAAGDEPRVAQLEAQVEQLHGQVAELAERLDFAERLLAQKRERTLRAGE